ncbi:MAG: aminotransferase class I/II-fold pyridoxal phosphate-dependent enzyme [Chitinophagaceae bacterium]
MRKGNSFYESVDQVVSHGVSEGILHLYNEDDSFTGSKITIGGKEMINFGSCSYLGLELDPRLRQAAKNAIDNYGTQFSESRAYVSLKLYRELEQLLEKIFGAHCVVTPTTTLGHIAAIPVLVSNQDAVIIDQQAHNSIQTAVTLLKPRGIPVEILRHSRMDLLEQRIQALSSHHQKVWYFADGIYSMFGDGCPLEEIYRFMDEYPSFHFYVDDAHGMSIHGKHGRGYVLEERRLHKKMVMASSLNKAFASGGGVLVFPDAEVAHKVRTCGGPMITSGPMQPAALGAAIAAARIHLSDEIYDMQSELREKRKYAVRLIEKCKLPLVSDPDASVFFIGAGHPKVGYNLVKRMMDKGFYLNLGIFPAVPMKQTGIRFTITRLHRFAQMESMITTLAKELPLCLKEENSSFAQIYQAFKMPPPEDASLDRVITSVLHQSLDLKSVHSKSIEHINKKEWNTLFACKGTFDWDGLLSLEDSFSGNDLPEDNWSFDYLMVKDQAGKVIAATFLTTALWKDDMLSAKEISMQVEEKRKKDPYYLVSKVTSTGSLLTEGEHLYIQKESPLWKEALHLLLEKTSKLQEEYQSTHLIIRDFHQADKPLDDLMIEEGFFRISMSDTNIVQDMEWDVSGFYEHLSKRSRQHYREDVKKHLHRYEVLVVKGTACSGELDYWYSLYLNVKGHNLELRDALELTYNRLTFAFERVIPFWKKIIKFY